ncbi:MAG: hypothetical protein JXQ27_06775 [Acidobacteria bacterium]|nr:hypothetical protein [Acidobacteriota bacterium]
MKLSKRDKRILRIGGVVSGMILVVMYLIIPFVGYLNDMDDRKNLLEAQLLRMVQNISAEELYQQGLLEMKDEADALLAALPEAQDAESAGRELMRIINSLAEEREIEVSRITPSKNPERFDLEEVKKNPLLARFLKIKVTASLSCRPDHLASLLLALENYDRYLVVEKLEIRAWGVKADKIIKPNITLATLIYQPAVEENATGNPS